MLYARLLQVAIRKEVLRAISVAPPSRLREIVRGIPAEVIENKQVGASAAVHDLQVSSAPRSFGLSNPDVSAAHSYWTLQSGMFESLDSNFIGHMSTIVG